MHKEPSRNNGAGAIFHEPPLPPPSGTRLEAGIAPYREIFPNATLIPPLIP